MFAEKRGISWAQVFPGTFGKFLLSSMNFFSFYENPKSSTSHSGEYSEKIKFYYSLSDSSRWKSAHFLQSQVIQSLWLQKRNQLRDLQLGQLKDLHLDPVTCLDTFLLKISNTEIMNLLLWFPHRRKVLEITNMMSVWISFLNCAVNEK